MQHGDEGRWTVRGQVELSSVAPLQAPVWVSVIDLDPIEHDLAASGWTDTLGRFSLWFTLRDFNIQPFERERWPDVWIVLQRDPADQRSVLYSRGFPRSAWEGHTLTAVIGLDQLDDETGVREVPRHSGRPVTRTRLTRTRLQRLPQAVADQLATVTDLRTVETPRGVVVGQAQRSVVEQVLRRAGDWTTGWCGLVTFHELETVTYDPIDDVLVVHPSCRTMTAAVVEVLIARALVARMQFQMAPNLIGLLTTAVRDLWSDLHALDRDVRHDSRDARRRFDRAAASILVDSTLTNIAATLDEHAARLDRQYRLHHPSLPVPAIEPSVATRLLQSVALRFNLGFRQVDTVLDSVRRADHPPRTVGLPDWFTGGS